MILRLSHRLARKVKVGKLEQVPLDPNPCADWSCRLFIAERKQYIALSNTVSLYTCVMRGKGVTSHEEFVTQAMGTIADFMSVDGLQDTFQQLAQPSLGEVTFAKSASRSVSGSMGDLVHASKLDLSDGFDMHEINHRLNATPLSALIGPGGRKYGHPREVFVRLTGQAFDR